MPGAPNPHIALPCGLFGAERANSLGLNLSNEAELARLATALRDSAAQDWRAAPLLAGMKGQGLPRPVLNPANHRDRVGMVVEASAEAVGSALPAATAEVAMSR